MTETMDPYHRDLRTLMQQLRGFPPAHIADTVWEWLEAQGFREEAHAPTDDDREAPTEQDWRAAHQDGGVIFAKVRRSVVPVLLMRGKYGDWSSETGRYRSADVEEVISVYRWVPAGMQDAWASEIVADFRRVAEPQGEPSDARVEAGCVAFYEHATDLTSWARLMENDAVLADRYRDGIRRALRAAEGAR